MCLNLLGPFQETCVTAGGAPREDAAGGQAAGQRRRGPYPLLRAGLPRAPVRAALRRRAWCVAHALGAACRHARFVYESWERAAESVPCDALLHVLARMPPHSVLLHSPPRHCRHASKDAEGAAQREPGIHPGHRLANVYHTNRASSCALHRRGRGEGGAAREPGVHPGPGVVERTTRAAPRCRRPMRPRARASPPARPGSGALAGGTLSALRSSSRAQQHVCKHVQAGQLSLAISTCRACAVEPSARGVWGQVKGERMFQLFPVKGVRQSSQRLSSRGLHAHDLPCITYDGLEHL